MQADLKQSLIDVLDSEGGWTQSPAEPGGASNWGISMTTWTDYCKNTNKPVPTLDDLKALTIDQASDFYEEIWANAINFSQLPVGVDYRLLDISVNLGLTGGINLLQGVLDIPTTSKVDGTTMLALTSYQNNTRLAETLIMALGDAWLANKKQSANWSTYALGWTIRKERADIQAIDMATGG